MKISKNTFRFLLCQAILICTLILPAYAIGNVTIDVPPTDVGIAPKLNENTVDMNEHLSIDGDIKWSIEDPEKTGATVRSDGICVVSSKCNAGTATVIANNGSGTDRISVVIKKDENEYSLYAANVKLPVGNYVAAPEKNAAPLTLACTSEVYGYYGMPMTENEVERSYYLLENFDNAEQTTALHGVTIDPDTGVITIPWTADTCEIYVGVLFHTKMFTVGSGQYASSHTLLKITTPQSSLQTGFSDVGVKSYCALPVTWAVANNITLGTSATKFSPSATCTRGQIITFLWRAAGSPTPTAENPFSDVLDNQYYTKAAIWAYEQKLVNGDQFHPQDDCTRAAAVEFMWRLNGAPTYDTKSADFTDVAPSASYADAVEWAVKTGVTKGISDTAFGPEATCNRGQIVTFLLRAFR